MASETPSPSAARAETPAVSPTWLRGVAAGLVGGLGMGAFLTLTAPPVVEETVPALVGLAGPLAGWTVHMTVSALLGVVFTAAVERRPDRRPLTTAVVLGIAYSIALWLAAGLAVPTWLDVIGANGLPVPWLDPSVLAGLLVYGVVLGIAHWLFG